MKVTQWKIYYQLIQNQFNSPPTTRIYCADFLSSSLLPTVGFISFHVWFADKIQAIMIEWQKR